MKNIYVCGPTVYSSPHIGNMRPIFTFDIYRRGLEALGEKVNFIHNITDIDDKIINKALEQGITEEEVAKRYEKEYKDLLKQANIITPNLMPKVIEHMEEIIMYIKKLIAKGNAYESEGNVYFSVKSVSCYGKISNRLLDDMKYEGGVNKKHPGDFALWKATKQGVKFDSPWGKGRPGWHTECSVFIDKEFKGQSVDIHGGGIDLVFPHHENENAQHFALHGNPIAAEWRHVGHLNFNGEKMSKSLGNILTAKEYFKKYSADILRYIFLTSSYSSPINLTDELSKQAFLQVEKFRKIFLKSQVICSNDEEVDVSVIAKELVKWRFSNSMKEVNSIVKEFNINENEENANKVICAMKLLGFDFSKRVLSNKEKEMVMKWNDLRDRKLYNEADLIKAKLEKNNII